MSGVRRRSVLAAFGGTVAAGAVAGGTGAAQAAEAAEMGAAAAPKPGRPGRNRYEREISALLRKMTVDEKLGQLQQLPWSWDTGPGGGGTEAATKAAREGRLGSVLSIYGGKANNALQKIAVEETRLGIPLLYGFDVIHGLWTTFPIPLAQAASFDPAVAATDAEVSAKEARTNGIHWTFAPMMDVTHEPRWGRIAEGNGEDPYLTAELAKAKVLAYQGTAKGRDLKAKDKLAACAKHYVAYGGAEGGRDYNTVIVSESQLRNYYLPPFKAAIDADCATVMASFNTINGVPAHGNSHTLNEILKDEWDFDGLVVSDWTGVQELIPHGFAADGAEAARLGLNAGVDMEMTSTHLVTNGKKLLRSGQISERRLDDAVRRVLRLKYELGLFENPYVDEAAVIGEPTPETRKAARDTAARSMVLLKNDKKALPLAPTTKSVAVVGPFGDSKDLLGAWAFPFAAKKAPAITVLEGVKAAVPDAKVTYALGVDADGKDTSKIPAAVDAAKAADVTVVVVGEAAALSGEAAARSDISLPGGQEQLIAAIAATGKPFVVVLVNGRPLTVGDWLASAPAVLEAWHGGTEAGNAVADVLFGKVNPGGKLPVTFPRTVGQIPIYYNHESTGRPYDPKNKYTSKYLDLPNGPEFAFGHGLSYTTFETSAPKLGRDSVSARALRSGDTVEVSVTVTNTGTREGDEVVQLYVHDKFASIVQPVRKLRGFRRVTLAAGKSTTVRFPLGADDLGFWTNSEDGKFVIEPGDIDVYVGTSSDATAKAALKIT
ncbi:beta-glucosidase [Streptomyces spiroverticillatus]|uniref:Exo-alpha-(1->6)-L-arabinopyranosidase n=1 Tax=Streptomyces finlayi TaxID=67296 RepID=A0A918WZD9_9ACTN|nr:beta-glucosidase BglX [Streptomyces finlayi]GHA14151.1 beta-glucosidase [Streptomyces spiroverticillatus]GHC97495.1 beta-glucosidase [Streptomyces finlayi]